LPEIETELLVFALARVWKTERHRSVNWLVGEGVREIWQGEGNRRSNLHYITRNKILYEFRPL